MSNINTSHEHQLGGHPGKRHLKKSFQQYIPLRKKNYTETTFFSKGIVKDSKGFILKPVISWEEVEFYETLAQTQDLQLFTLKQFTPKYDGSKLERYFLLYRSNTFMKCILPVKFLKKILALP